MFNFRPCRGMATINQGKELELEVNDSIYSGLQCYQILNIMRTKEYKKEVLFGEDHPYLSV